ncbi:activating signal cointegrator 1 complex subunit 2 isoform X2 [Danaus plexippus]|uniref:activating signal cointegrator 1 complex subunit 2 isoform X2 n=1 Tax=Danaus plexippus TaxID=13037 RepID=UPI002AAFE95E|nr:activating signal cointegrator 1 complex subunit 2 isoform X2 [Danaus plexippus]
MNKSVEFKNPDNSPVESVTCCVSNDGVVQQIKALDPYWLEKRELTLYERPPSGEELVVGALDAWKSKMQVYLENLKWLLGLEHHRFWSTILYHPQCMDCLISFIQEVSPPYLPAHECGDVRGIYEEIRRLVLVVFSRLITNKESKNQWMTKEYLADIIYNNFIFTIPVLWDLCLAYGVDNARHISKMVDTVYTLQPTYNTDTLLALTFVQESFKYIIMQVNKDYESEEPPNLPETFKGFGEIRRPSGNRSHDKLTFNVLRDLVIHMLDTAMTLRIFVEVYPKAAELMKKTNFVLSVVQLYEYGIPQLYEVLLEVGDETSVTYTEVECYIDMTRSEIIDTFREMLAVYKNAIFSGDGNISSNVESYLSLIMEALSERLLIKDYHSCYPLHEDIDMLRQAYPDIDSVKTDFILQAIFSNIDDQAADHTNQAETNVRTESASGHTENGDVKEDIPDHVKEESLISEVKDILPHLGDGFILKCLQHYGFNSERVINTVLEDSLDESLRGLDRSLPIIPEDVLDQKFLETGVQRLNVFDGDEFDIMTRDDVDLSKIHIGKRKEKYKDLKDMLDDKTAVKNRMDIYSKYNLVCDESAMYSDEYDDTYDEETPVTAATELDDRRTFVTPRVLRAKEEVSTESEEEIESNNVTVGANTGTSTNRSRMDFCVNPEEIRARREAARAARGGRGYSHKNADVTGKPKGQGQEKEVLLNRDRKEKNKSSKGNHGRRQGAQWKRSQGMMPS